MALLALLGSYAQIAHVVLGTANLRDVRTPGRVWSVVVLLVCLSGCLQPVSENTVLGPEGGTLTIGGVTLQVPPGALSSSTRLTVTSVDVAPPAGSRAIGGAIQLGPEGIVFGKPITLELPLSSEPAAVFVATAPTGTRDFELLPASHRAMRATVELRHFSIFIPVAPDDADGGTDAGLDAGTDAGVDAGTDAGGDAGFDAGSPLELCQSDWVAIRWWELPDAGPGLLNVVAEVTELPGAWVFTVGPLVYSVDRASRQVIETHDTSVTGVGGVSGFNALRLPNELRLVQEFRIGPSAPEYREYQLDLNGRFTQGGDGGLFRALTLPGASVSRGGWGPGSVYISAWSSIVVAAFWDQPVITMLPLQGVTPLWTAQLPAGMRDSTGALELADGTVLIGLNWQDPPFPQNPVASARTDAYVLTRDGGLVPTGWTVFEASPPWGQIFSRGGDAGAAMTTFDRQSVTVRALDGSRWTGAIPDAGRIWPSPGSLGTTPSGRIVVLLPVSPQPLRYGLNIVPEDLYVMTWPPGNVYRLLTGLRAFSPVTIGAVREDSFMLVYLDETRNLRAARICLPP